MIDLLNTFMGAVLSVFGIIVLMIAPIAFFGWIGQRNESRSAKREVRDNPHPPFEGSLEDREWQLRRQERRFP